MKLYNMAILIFAAFLAGVFAFGWPVSSGSRITMFMILITCVHINLFIGRKL